MIKKPLPIEKGSKASLKTDIPRVGLNLPMSESNGIAETSGEHLQISCS